MFQQISIVTGMALAVQLIALPCSAKEEKEYKLSQWDLGKVLFGEKHSKSDLKGKVVVIENWGVMCPPCIASLPHLAELDRKYRDKGLVIIGAESQGHGKADIKPVIEKAKVEFTITEGAEGPIDFTAIPRVFVFDSTGSLVYNGSPSGEAFDKSITDALDSMTPSSDAAVPSSGPLIAERSWTNSAGVAIKAAVKSVDANNVTFLMPSGKETIYPLDKLSDESRKVIEEAGKAKE